MSDEPDIFDFDAPMIDLGEMIAAPGVAPKTWQSKAPEFLYTGSKPPIADSADLRRVLALPRRPQLDLESERARKLAELISTRYRRERTTPCRCAEIDPDRFKNGNVGCIRCLNAAQAWALYEIGIVQGCEGPIGVGHGKCGTQAVEIINYSTGRRQSIAEVGSCSVATFDRTLHVTAAAAFPSGHKACVRFTLADGSSAEFSTDHKILTHRGWIEAAHLRPEADFVTVAVTVPDVSRTLATDDEVTLVAYLNSDGSCSQQGLLGFTQMPGAVLSDWHRVVSALHLRVSVSVLPGAKSKAGQYRIIGDRVRAFRDKWDLYGLAKDKRTHASIWGLPRRQVALFLNRFWACDGHVSKQSVECTLASEKLVDDLRFLGTRLGIRFRKQYKPASYVKDGVRHEFDAWRITAYGAAALKFLDEVGDVLGKEPACQALRARILSTRRNTNHDVVPIGRKELAEICDELGIPSRGGSNAKRGEHTRQQVRDYFQATAGQYVSRERFVSFCREWGYTGKYAHLALTDCAWERVVSVEDIGVHPVFDLTVPGTHNFVANGIVVHNTILDLLTPLALADAWVAENARRGVVVDRAKYVVLLLVPPGLQKQLDREYQLLSQHFRVPSIVFHALPINATCEGEPTLHVYPYSKLSRPEATTFFRTLRPHAVIADEAHALGDPNAVRTGRFITYMESDPTVRFCNWTGSLTNSSIEDYAHLAKFALKSRSPLPVDPETVKEWASALDPGKGDDDWDADPGALLAGLVRTGCQLAGEHVYVGFNRRLVETLGVVAVTSPAVSCEVEIYERQPHVAGHSAWQGSADDHVPNVPREDPRAPEIEGRPAGVWPGIADCLEMVRGGVRPDGEELLENFAKARCARELASGFFYRWIFPRGEAESLIKRWREARKAYRREVREQMESRAEHMDSPYLCQLAAMRYHGDIPRGGVVEVLDEESGEVRIVDTTHLPAWASKHWPAWRDVRKLVEPATEPVWIDEYLALDAVEWAREHTGIVWYDHSAFGKMVAKLGGFPMFGGGSDALDRLVGNKEKKIRGEDGSRSIVLSIASHGTGRDGLQRLFCEQLVANPLASAKGWEQLLGRLHRIGQLKPSTRTWFYRHTEELQAHVDQALALAFYVESTIGASQKLRMGFKLDR